MACFPGLGVAPLQSESRYKSRRWRGVKKGEEAKGTKQPRKEKVRCQRERGVKAAEKTDKCSKSCLTLHDVFFSPNTRHSLCSSSFVASHPSPFLPSVLVLHMRHSHSSISISLYLVCMFYLQHTHTLFIISHVETSLLVCPHLSLPSISPGSTLNTIPLYIRTRSKPIRPFLSYTSPTFLSLPPVLIGLLLSSKWAFLFGRFSVLNEYLNWSF